MSNDKNVGSQLGRGGCWCVNLKILFVSLSVALLNTHFLPRFHGCFFGQMFWPNHVAAFLEIQDGVLAFVLAIDTLA